jgi:hypothetical protein
MRPQLSKLDAWPTCAGPDDHLLHGLFSPGVKMRITSLPRSIATSPASSTCHRQHGGYAGLLSALSRIRDDFGAHGQSPSAPLSSLPRDGECPGPPSGLPLAVPEPLA